MRLEPGRSHLRKRIDASFGDHVAHRLYTILALDAKVIVDHIDDLLPCQLLVAHRHIERIRHDLAVVLQPWRLHDRRLLRWQSNIRTSRKRIANRKDGRRPMPLLTTYQQRSKPTPRDTSSLQKPIELPSAPQAKNKGRE